jgi:prefoldin subunit 5
VSSKPKTSKEIQEEIDEINSKIRKLNRRKDELTRTLAMMPPETP